MYDLPILIAIIIFSVVVVIHELGHFFAARKCGVYVEEFAVGLGPKLLSRKGKTGTLYSLRAFPIGGFCKMRGQEGGVDDPESFSSKKVSQRIFIIMAGIILNVVLALVISFIIVSFNSFTAPTVHTVSENSPAATAGLQSGDRITRVNGKAVRIFADIPWHLEGTAGKRIPVEIRRGGEKITVQVIPVKTDGTERLGFWPGAKTALFAPSIDGFDRAGLFETAGTAFYQTAFYVRATFVGVGRLVTNRLALSEFSGIVGFTGIIGDVYDDSVAGADELRDAGKDAPSNTSIAFWLTMQFIVILSANLGVMNLLPIPPLDGGRLVFLLIEAVRKKPINPEREGMIHLVGFVLLMILAAVITYNDILQRLPR